MSKSDMFSFMPQPEVVKQAKPVKEGKSIPWRISINQWEAVSALTVSERIKFQNYLDQLVEQDFVKRGLRWPD